MGAIYEMGSNPDPEIYDIPRSFTATATRVVVATSAPRGGALFCTVSASVDTVKISFALSARDTV